MATYETRKVRQDAENLVDMLVRLDVHGDEYRTELTTQLRPRLVETTEELGGDFRAVIEAVLRIAKQPQKDTF